MSILAKQIIQAYTERPYADPDGPWLRVSEFYYDTIQGEGVYTGQPSAFLRLTGCTMNCTYCDTKEVWRTGNNYTYDELLRMIPPDLVVKLHTGQHLVFTGGSPMIQQEQLVEFIRRFYSMYSFKPFVEMENECVLLPDMFTEDMVDCWNNSPKLSSSGVARNVRYKPTVIQKVAALPNSWFKFVITSEEDWTEIEKDFLKPALIDRSQVILMPEGATRQEVEAKRELTINLAIKHSVRYCTREHIIVWDKKVGI